MISRRYRITPQHISLLAIRVIALFFMLSAVSAFGMALAVAGMGEERRGVLLGPEAAGLACFLIVVLSLIVFQDPIARLMSRGLPRRGLQSAFSRLEVLSIALAAVAFLVALSSVPRLLTQLYSVLTYQHELIEQGVAEKHRFNLLIVGLIGSLLTVAAATMAFLWSGKMARVWERWQDRVVRMGTVRRKGN